MGNPSYWFVGGAERENTASSSSYSAPSCWSLSSTLPCTPEPGKSGGGGSGGNPEGPSGAAVLGDVRLSGPSEPGEQQPPPGPEPVPARVSSSPGTG